MLRVFLLFSLVPTLHVGTHTSLQGDTMKQVIALFILSAVLAAAEPEAINGYTLPPEPDPAVNNSTLLGIDVNNNGVRDDVERWIYKTYKNMHPVHIDIAMQAARAFKKVLETPEKAKEIRQVVSSPIYCEGYFSVYADKFGDKILINARVVDKRFENMYFNTSERNAKYLIYQNKLSGDSYTVPWPSKGKNYCDFNISKYEN
jgi:hypothetical protein